MSHVVEHILHGAAVRQVALPNLAVGLLSPLALVCVEQEDQLLLNQLPLLRVRSRGRCAGTCPYGIEPNLGCSHCCCSADRYPTDRPGLLLLRDLVTERREAAQTALENDQVRWHDFLQPFKHQIGHRPINSMFRFFQDFNKKLTFLLRHVNVWSD